MAETKPQSENNGEPSHEFDADVRLMRLVQADDAKAFETLVERYQNRVVGILYHMTGNMDEAEDLAQDAFLRVFRARHKYEPTAKFSTWLFTIVNHLALNAIRDRKRKQTTGFPDSDSGPMGARPLEQFASAPSAGSPSRILAKTELAEIIRAAVSQLPTDQRMAVMLNKFEDMSYKQIGEIMGKTEKAVKSLLARARATLKQLLEPYLTEGQPPPDT